MQARLAPGVAATSWIRPRGAAFVARSKEALSAGAVQQRDALFSTSIKTSSSPPSVAASHPAFNIVSSKSLKEDLGDVEATLYSHRETGAEILSMRSADIGMHFGIFGRHLHEVGRFWNAFWHFWASFP